MGQMAAERTAQTLECVECGKVWLPADDERWRAYLDTDDELVFYCPECAEREFD
jgi:RNase P subunit RPR2